MSDVEPVGVAPRCPLDPGEEFLLLPGDGLILVAADGRITYFDHRAQRLLGGEAVLGVGADLEPVWPALADALESHSVAISDSGLIDTRLSYGGSPRMVRLFRSDSGVGIVLLAERIPADGGAAEQQLQMHRSILRYVRDAVIVTTAEPVDSPGPLIVYANEAARRQTGYRTSELLGRSPRIFQGPGTDRGALSCFHQAMRHWQPTRQMVVNYRRNGTPFWVEIDIAPLADRDGWYTCWVSVQRECGAPAASAGPMAP
ncbi:MAG: PAS domain-containing protein [Cyanobium sp.]